MWLKTKHCFSSGAGVVEREGTAVEDVVAR